MGYKKEIRKILEDIADRCNINTLQANLVVFPEAEQELEKLLQRAYDNGYEVCKLELGRRRSK